MTAVGLAMAGTGGRLGMDIDDDPTLFHPAVVGDRCG
jgi:hypothetical protein